MIVEVHHCSLLRMSWRIARFLIWESVATNLMRVALALLQNLLSGFEVLFAQ